MTLSEISSPTRRIIGLFPELLGVGGIQEAGRLTAAALCEISRGHNWFVEFLSLNDPLGLHSIEAAGQSISFRGFGRAKARFALSALGRSAPFAKSAAPIVFAAHPHLAVPAHWMRRVSPRLKTVVMSHGLEVWKPLSSNRQRALLCANLVLAPSTFTSRKLADVQFVRRERIRTLPWPLNPEFLSLAASPASLPLPSDAPEGRIILTVGRWSSAERYKGVDDLIRAVSVLRTTISDLHLIAAGGGDDLPRLQKLTSDVGAGDCVHFLTGLSCKELAACYAYSDLFALPSTGEGFGLVFLEAMAFAKPIVAVAWGGTTDIIENEANGLLVPPRDPSALAQALGRLLSDKSLRQQMGSRGAGIVRLKFSFSVFRSSLEHILLELISDSIASQ